MRRARECRELRPREAIVDHGERGEQPLAERLEPLEPPRHNLTQARRDRDLAGGVHRRRQLLREERVARRRALDRAEGTGLQRAGSRPLCDRRERAAVERTERQLDRGAALEQARAHERGRLRKRLIAHGGDHEQALAGRAARKMVHERHRCLIGGVQIIDYEHDAALCGGLPEQLTDSPEDPTAVDGFIRRARWAAHRRQQSRQRDLCAVGDRTGQLRAPRGERVERLHERRVRRAALLLQGGAAQRMKAQPLRFLKHSLEQARLADSRARPSPIARRHRRPPHAEARPAPRRALALAPRQEHELAEPHEPPDRA